METKDLYLSIGPTGKQTIALLVLFIRLDCRSSHTAGKGKNKTSINFFKCYQNILYIKLTHFNYIVHWFSVFLQSFASHHIRILSIPIIPKEIFVPITRYSSLHLPSPTLGNHKSTSYI